ncbi:hypothetical protein LZ30DRAFT_121422 [Colletotrichum cereale]|nr:hypothetical protein LZ30DRAFT_121422 [Colletotrichum cereale]
MSRLGKSLWSEAARQDLSAGTSILAKSRSLGEESRRGLQDRAGNVLLFGDSQVHKQKLADLTIPTTLSSRLFPLQYTASNQLGRQEMPVSDPAASQLFSEPHHGTCHRCDMPACDLARRISLQSWVLSHDIGGRQILVVLLLDQHLPDGLPETGPKDESAVFYGCLLSARNALLLRSVAGEETKTSPRRSREPNRASFPGAPDYAELGFDSPDLGWRDR